MNESVKNDVRDDKDPWHLLPLKVIKLIVKVYKYGAKKYGENRWQNLDNGYQRYKAALLRHLVAYEEGERFDRESGLPHLAHMAWNAIAMLYFDMVGKALRPEPYTELSKADEEKEILHESWKGITKFPDYIIKLLGDEEGRRWK